MFGQSVVHSIENQRNEIEIAKTSFGRADLFKFEDNRVNEYTYGGFGSRSDFNLIIVAGKCVHESTRVNIKYKHPETGEWKYSLREWDSPTIKDFYKRFHHENERDSKYAEEYYTRSVSEENGKLGWSKVKDVTYEGEKECFKLVTKTGKEIITTSEHRFFKNNGAWIRLEDLKPGDLIMVNPLKHNPIVKPKFDNRKIVKTFYHPNKGFKSFMIENKYGPYPDCDTFEYRLIYEAQMNGMTYEEYLGVLNNYDGRELKFIPEELIVHHKDGNGENNSLENLEVLTKQEHAKKHPKTTKIASERYCIPDEVVSIENVGLQPVYDIWCEDGWDHNFMGNNIVLHNTNVGKTLFTQNMILPIINQGKRFAYFLLEDSVKGTMARLEKIIDPEIFRKADKLIFTEEDTKDLYKIGDALDIIEYMFSVENCEVVIIDHLQFLFESIERVGDLNLRDDNGMQRYIMRKLNRIAKLHQKTLICVSHVNKSSAETTDMLDMIIGSSALVQAATQVFFLQNKEGDLTLNMIKSRYTKKEYDPLYITYDENLRLKVDDKIKSDDAEEVLGD